MGMMQRFKRLHYVYGWRLKYWCLDTDDGRRAQLTVFIASCFVSIVLFVHMTVQGYLLFGNSAVEPETAPLKAASPFVVRFILFLVSLAISYATRPRPERPQPLEQEVPVVEDGLAAPHVFGTVWIDDQFQLAHKNLSPIPIKKKGGKK